MNLIYQLNEQSWNTFESFGLRVENNDLKLRLENFIGNSPKRQIYIGETLVHFDLINLKIIFY